MSLQWSAVEKEDKDQIHEQKIRCAYLPAADDGTVNGPNGTIHEEEVRSNIPSDSLHVVHGFADLYCTPRAWFRAWKIAPK